MDIEVQKNRALEDELSNLKKIYRGSRDEELNVMEKTLPVLQGRIEELETDSRINKRDADDAKNLAKKLIVENIELKTVVNKLLSSPNSNSNQNEQKSSSPLQAQQPTNQELPKMSTQPSSSNEKAQNEQYSFQIAQMLGNFAQFEREVRNREEAFRRAVADRDSEIERLRFELAKNLDSMPVPQRIPANPTVAPPPLKTTNGSSRTFAGPEGRTDRESEDSSSVYYETTTLQQKAPGGGNIIIHKPVPKERTGSTSVSKKPKYISYGYPNLTEEDTKLLKDGFSLNVGPNAHISPTDLKAFIKSIKLDMKSHVFREVVRQFKKSSYSPTLDEYLTAVNKSLAGLYSNEKQGVQAQSTQLSQSPLNQAEINQIFMTFGSSTPKFDLPLKDIAPPRKSQPSNLSGDERNSNVPSTYYRETSNPRLSNTSEGIRRTSTMITEPHPLPQKPNFFVQPSNPQQGLNQQAQGPSSSPKLHQTQPQTKPQHQVEFGNAVQPVNITPIGKQNKQPEQIPLSANTETGRAVPQGGNSLQGQQQQRFNQATQPIQNSYPSNVTYPSRPSPPQQQPTVSKPIQQQSVTPRPAQPTQLPTPSQQSFQTQPANVSFNNQSSTFTLQNPAQQQSRRVESGQPSQTISSATNRQPSPPVVSNLVPHVQQGGAFVNRGSEQRYTGLPIRQSQEVVSQPSNTVIRQPTTVVTQGSPIATQVISSTRTLTSNPPSQTNIQIIQPGQQTIIRRETSQSPPPSADNVARLVITQQPRYPSTEPVVIRSSREESPTITAVSNRPVQNNYGPTNPFYSFNSAEFTSPPNLSIFTNRPLAHNPAAVNNTPVSLQQSLQPGENGESGLRTGEERTSSLEHSREISYLTASPRVSTDQGTQVRTSLGQQIQRNY